MKTRIYLPIALLSLTACSDSFLDTENTRYLNTESAAEIAAQKPETLISYLNGIWSFMVSYDITGSEAHDDFGFTSIYHATDMMGEDLFMYNFHWFGYDYDFDNREETYRRTRANWQTLYTLVAKANEIISFFPETPDAPDSKGLLGQGYAVRAFAYLYLIQLYQFPVAADGTPDYEAPGVPLYYSDVEGIGEEEQTLRKGRNTVADVFEQIESDLTAAVELLEAGYQRPNKMFIDAGVAHGILARYYLLSGRWQAAAQSASAARQGYPIMKPDQKGLFDGFMDIENTEWMWGFDHTTETQTTYASLFSHLSNLTPGYSGMLYSGRGIDKRLYDLIPESDYRKGLFGSPEGDPYQYTEGAREPYALLKFGWDGAWTMDYVYMRAAEMVLIEAEAEVRLGNDAKAAEILAELMSQRDATWQKETVTLDDILLQRRIELIGEGFAYFDLKRNNLGIDRDYEGSPHLPGYKHRIPPRDKRWTYKIPLVEIQENIQISEQEQND
ncbi:MAG: RagB/SusD family nutrient uptake outer membrane protein [Tannerellaceae bacterium]|jgi:hypothetical protein|nr:RagB/SusD family nutrient uptake outer membrane protein [Tannerellaceae bacterium]